ncbi:MAG: nucleotidyltransferase family protein [Thermoplasmatota archaeon]
MQIRDRKAALSNVAALAQLSRGLSARGVAHRAFKGPALSAQLYGDAAFRHAGDLDILVQPHHLNVSIEVLQSLGYTLLAGRPPAPLDLDWHALPLQRGRVFVDLHWRTMSEMLLPERFETDMWSEAEEVQVGGTLVPTVKGDVRLDHLLLHAAGSRWHRLIWIVDIADCLERHEPRDWPAVLSDWKRRGVLRRCLIGLNLAASLGWVPPEPVARASAADRKVERLRRRVKNSWLTVNPAPRLIHMKMDAEAMDFPADRLRMWAKVARFHWNADAPGEGVMRRLFLVPAAVAKKAWHRRKVASTRYRETRPPR